MKIELPTTDLTIYRGTEGVPKSAFLGPGWKSASFIGANCIGEFGLSVRLFSNEGKNYLAVAEILPVDANRTRLASVLGEISDVFLGYTAPEITGKYSSPLPKAEDFGRNEIAEAFYSPVIKWKKLEKLAKDDNYVISKIAGKLSPAKNLDLAKFSDILGGRKMIPYEVQAPWFSCYTIQMKKLDAAKGSKPFSG